MERKIIQIGDKRLLEVSEKVQQGDIKKQEVKDIIKDLLDTMAAHEGSAAGLSAVQIGVLKRVCVVKRVDLNTQDQPFQVMINPELIFESKYTSVEWEGCMSINTDNQRLYGPVARSRVVEVAFFDEEGYKKTLKASDFFSHLIQHEIDHMDGVLFLQYVKNPKNIWKEYTLDKYIKEHGHVPSIV